MMRSLKILTSFTLVLMCISVAHAGRLLVSSETTNEILQFDANTGIFQKVLVAATGNNAGLNSPTAMTIGPDGHLYVTSLVTNTVEVYDVDSGNPIASDFVASGAGGLTNPRICGLEMMVISTFCKVTPIQRG